MTLKKQKIDNISKKEDRNLYRWQKILLLPKHVVKRRTIILVACLFGILLMATCAIYYVAWIASYRTSSNVPPSALSPSVSIYSTSYCTCSGSTITCTHVPDAVYIENELYDFQSCFANKLIIKNSSLTTIPAYFLANFSSSFTSINIQWTDIVEMEDNAFSSSAFKYVRDIVFDNNRLTYFRKKSFHGIQSAETFVLSPSGLAVTIFEKNFFEYLSTIHTLQFHNCILTVEALTNLTASDVTLSRLTNIDFGFNEIPILTEKIFFQLRAVTLFNINRSGLTTIEVRAFHGLISLKTLNLSDNNLRTLPEGAFGSVTLLFIHNNPWTCNCSLNWLKVLYTDTTIINKEIPARCDNYDYKEYREVEFCPESNTTEATEPTGPKSTEPNEGTTTKENTTQTTSHTESEKTTTEESTTTTDSREESKYKKIACRDWERSPILTESLSRVLVYTQNIFTEFENFTFEFYEVDEEPVLMAVVITGNPTGFHLLWFNSRNINETGCVTNMGNTIILNELQRAETYTYCVLYGDRVVVSPYDCFGFEVRVEYGERAWIRNKHSKLMIISSSIIVLLVILLSVTITYCCVRRHPVLIKGNKRVIIVGKKKPEEPTAPKEYEKPAYTPPSIDSFLSSAQSNGYTRIRQRQYRSPVMRSASEQSFFSNEISYIRPTGPSTFQLNTWRVNLRTRPQCVDVFEEPIRGTNPPPLPPPNDVQYLLPTDENPYTTL